MLDAIKLDLSPAEGRAFLAEQLTDLLRKKWEEIEPWRLRAVEARDGGDENAYEEFCRRITNVERNYRQTEDYLRKCIKELAGHERIAHFITANPARKS